MRSEESNYTDQGLQEFNYALLPATTKEKAKIFRRALAFNTKLTSILENHHKGTLPLCYKGIDIDAENIVLSVLKKAEDGNGYVVRAYECIGRETVATIHVKELGKHTVRFTPYEVKTFYVASNKAWEEVLFTEYKN